MTNNHVRNIGPMMASRRCGAKTRSGKACMSPAVSGKSRCRMHGGAAGSGAPLATRRPQAQTIYAPSLRGTPASAVAAAGITRVDREDPIVAPGGRRRWASSGA